MPGVEVAPPQCDAACPNTPPCLPPPVASVRQGPPEGACLPPPTGPVTFPPDFSMNQRVYNFSAGPAVLPESVLETVQRDLLCLPGAGASILEISHRGKPFQAILDQAETNLRKLLGISDDYAVLFLQGGSRLQFSMIPMNLLTDSQSTADYIVTGSWGKNALKEANKHGSMHVAYNGESTNFDRLPAPENLSYSENPAYVHYTSNETIQGVQFAAEPEVGDAPLVCDASSDFLHRPLPIDRYGLIYACAQKNAGPAGVTIVVIRRSLLERSQSTLPGYLNYQVHTDANSLANTPTTFGIYVVGLVTQWLLEEIGGLERMHEQNRQKASMLYDVIDAHPEFYQGHAQPDCRSLMNVTFRLPSDDLTQQFLAGAAEKRLHSLAGHRSVGGIRASIYNAMPPAGVETLRDFMLQFCQKHG